MLSAETNNNIRYFSLFVAGLAIIRRALCCQLIICPGPIVQLYCTSP